MNTAFMSSIHWRVGAGEGFVCALYSASVSEVTLHWNCWWLWCWCLPRPNLLCQRGDLMLSYSVVELGGGLVCLFFLLSCFQFHLWPV